MVITQALINAFLPKVLDVLCVTTSSFQNCECVKNMVVNYTSGNKKTT